MRLLGCFPAGPCPPVGASCSVPESCFWRTKTVLDREQRPGVMVTAATRHLRGPLNKLTVPS
jgi:hypothetical protein